MKQSMVARDAETFVALGRAIGLAAQEGTLSPEESADLCGALVAGILTGCMELDTYARIHEVLARLLDRAFEGPARTLGTGKTGGRESETREPLGVYLEVIGDAWDSVSYEDESCRRIRSLARRVFDLAKARFDNGAWFSAPLRGTVDETPTEARVAGLLVVSIQGVCAAGPLVASLVDPETDPNGYRLVLGWGERRTALDLSPAA